MGLLSGRIYCSNGWIPSSQHEDHITKPTNYDIVISLIHTHGSSVTTVGIGNGHISIPRIMTCIGDYRGTDCSYIYGYTAYVVE